MKLLTVVGTRPEYIKAAAIAHALPKFAKIEHVLLNTGQHFDANMCEIFFNEMQMPAPDINFKISGKTHGAMTGEILAKIEEALLKEKPDWVLVYGDTNSTLAGALAAVKLHIPLAHVEAGLRSYNLRMPEEINRIVTDRISNVMFCPTQEARANLLKEGLSAEKIFVVGDVNYDVALHYAGTARPSPSTAAAIERNPGFLLCSLHRAENTDDPKVLAKLVATLNKLAQTHPIIMPLHPRTALLLKENRLQLTNVTCLEPVGFFDMICLLQTCKMVLTDSGGLQKEAYFFKRPCITLRTETEWVETVEVGCNLVVGQERRKILDAVSHFQVQDVSFAQELYGNGKTAEAILQKLLEI